MKPWRVDAIVPPGLEPLAQEELSELGVQSQLGQGRLSLVAHPDALMRLNVLALIPSRFLVVVGSFRATHFVEFKKKLLKAGLEQFLSSSTVEFKITCKHCKLYHTGAIEEAAVAALNVKPKASLLKGEVHEPALRLFIRGEDDTFSISIDSSGEHLHRRGILLHRGEAPLRENLAAALVRLGRFSQPELWDPCCGSGTLLVENYLLETHTPLFQFRSYAFEHWACFDEDRYDKLKEKCLEAQKTCQTRMMASDIDAKVLEAAKSNFERLGCLNDVEVFKADLQHTSTEKFPAKLQVLCNPPYGERLARGKSVLKVMKSWAQSHSDWQVRVLLPSSQRDQGRSLLSFRNGGKPVELLEL